MSVINVMGSIKRAVPQGSGHHEIPSEGAILIRSLKDVNVPKIAFEDEVCKFDFINAHIGSNFLLLSDRLL